MRSLVDADARDETVGKEAEGTAAPHDQLPTSKDRLQRVNERASPLDISGVNNEILENNTEKQQTVAILACYAICRLYQTVKRR